MNSKKTDDEIEIVQVDLTNYKSVSKARTIKLNQNSYYDKSVKMSIANNLSRRSSKIIASCLNRRTKLSHCIFFKKFGYCWRGNECARIHDPLQICTKLRFGKCNSKNCPFSHDLEKCDLPTCRFYLEGICYKGENCKYPHINVGPRAPICSDFINGNCLLKDQCSKKHILVCPKFAIYKKCFDKKCQLKHLKSKSSITHKSNTKRFEKDNSFIPIDMSDDPIDVDSFIDFPTELNIHPIFDKPL